MVRNHIESNLNCYGIGPDWINEMGQGWIGSDFKVHCHVEDLEEVQGKGRFDLELVTPTSSLEVKLAFPEVPVIPDLIDRLEIYRHEDRHNHVWDTNGVQESIDFVNSRPFHLRETPSELDKFEEKIHKILSEDPNPKNFRSGKLDSIIPMHKLSHVNEFPLMKMFVKNSVYDISPQCIITRVASQTRRSGTMRT